MKVDWLAVLLEFEKVDWLAVVLVALLVVA